MRFGKGLLAAAVIAGLASGALADAPELSTPKLGALAFVRAMEQNNPEAFANVTLGAEQDRKLFEPLLRMVGAAKDLEKAARQKFGKSGRVVVRDSPAVGLEVQVQESTVTISGDSAVVRHASDDGSEPLTLRKTSDGWKVDLTAIQHRQEMLGAAPSMQRLEKSLSDTAAEIRSGRFKSAEEAEQTLLQRMQQASQNK
jgi:hypothetical protein